MPDQPQSTTQLTDLDIAILMIDGTCGQLKEEADGKKRSGEPAPVYTAESIEAMLTVLSRKMHQIPAWDSATRAAIVSNLQASLRVQDKPA